MEKLQLKTYKRLKEFLADSAPAAGDSQEAADVSDTEGELHPLHGSSAGHDTQGFKDVIAELQGNDEAF